MSREAFLSAAKESIARMRKAGSEAVIVHHNDADGLSSAAALQVALSRARFAVQRIPLERVHPPIVARIHDRFPSTILYVDLGGRAAPVISEANRGRRFTIILDHHHPERPTDPRVVNLATEFYGLSGEMDISAAPQTIAELRRWNYGVVFLFTDFPQRLWALLQNIGQPA